jgi:hypothetical protein
MPRRGKEDCVLTSFVRDVASDGKVGAITIDGPIIEKQIALRIAGRLLHAMRPQMGNFASVEDLLPACAIRCLSLKSQAIAFCFLCVIVLRFVRAIR